MAQPPKNNNKQQLINSLGSIGDSKIGKDLLCLIKSRYRIIYVRSCEELRVLDTFRSLASIEGFELYQWDLSRGLLDSISMQQVKTPSPDVHSVANSLLSYIIEQTKSDNKKIKPGHVAGDGKVYMLLDFHIFLRGDNSPLLQRRLKEFFEISSVSCIVIVAPVFECPPALEKEFTLVDFPYPSKDEYKQCLMSLQEHIPMKFPDALKALKNNEENLLQAVSGLTLVESENAFALSLVKTKTFDIPTILNEKKQIIRKGGILEYRDSRFKFDDIGGLDNLKNWLHLRHQAFCSDATQYGISCPKGILLVGTPGCGKSMVCDALASTWLLPLIRLDVGSLMSKYIGSSESNVRQVINVLNSIAPCILWVDEVEKGIGGVRSSNSTDGGVTNRVFGTLLTWMQEKTEPVFVICTANSVDDLPPEFMRAGRFDEIFFLDLPNESQRIQVIKCLLTRKNRNPDLFDIELISQKSHNYSPAEIEKAINNSLFSGFCNEKREITTDDILSELSKFQPMYNSRCEQINKMRSWALGEDGQGGCAVLANMETEQHVIPQRSRCLDLT